MIHTLEHQTPISALNSWIVLIIGMCIDSLTVIYLLKGIWLQKGGGEIFLDEDEKGDDDTSKMEMITLINSGRKKWFLQMLNEYSIV